jgi:hypothetical protein
MNVAVYIGSHVIPPPFRSSGGRGGVLRRHRGW